MSELPAVDTQRLAKCLGLEAWPGWLKLQNWHQHYAARAITDALQPDSIDGKVHADTALKNAEAWIDYAYDKGRREGAEMERRQWERRIRRIFEFEAPR